MPAAGDERRQSRAGSRMPSSRSNCQCRVWRAMSARISLARRTISGRIALELRFELGPQRGELGATGQGGGVLHTVVRDGVDAISGAVTTEHPCSPRSPVPRRPATVARCPIFCEAPPRYRQDCRAAADGEERDLTVSIATVRRRRRDSAGIESACATAQAAADSGKRRLSRAGGVEPSTAGRGWNRAMRVAGERRRPISTPERSGR